MRFGEISGLVNGTEQVVYDYEVGSARTTIDTATDSPVTLNGNEDGWYTIITRLVSAGTATGVSLRFNGDGGANYGYRVVQATSTTVADETSSTATGIFQADSVAVNNVSLCVTKIYVKSGAVRTGTIHNVRQVSNTTRTIGNLRSGGVVWNNTTDNITSMSWTASGANELGAGTRVIVLKSNNFPGGTPTGSITTPGIKKAWRRIDSKTLLANSASIEFTGLDGDMDELYYMVGTYKQGASNTDFGIHVNGDTTASDYGVHALYFENTTITGQRYVNSGSFYMTFKSATAGQYGNFEMLFFARSGHQRTALVTGTIGISGTTVTEGHVIGCMWSDVSNVISMKLETVFNSFTFDAGTTIDLYALRPTDQPPSDAGA